MGGTTSSVEVGGASSRGLSRPKELPPIVTKSEIWLEKERYIEISLKS
jgi:hypothetical protein